MRKLLWLLLLSVPALGQIYNPSVTYVSVAPSGACSQAPPVQVLNSSGAIYTCNNGTWAAQGGSSGTVTSVSGTTNQIDVASGTTTPVISFDANALSSLGGAPLASPAFTGTPTAPSINSLPLNYYSSTTNETIGPNGIPSGATGQFNTNYSVNGMSGCTSCTLNAGFGYGALAALTSGTGNLGIGVNALTNISTTNYNVGIGLNAGRYISGGSTANTASVDGIFIGEGTQPLTATDSNEIVICFACTGSGTNTTTLGASSATAAYINGTIHGSAGILPASARKGTFTCTNGGTITIANTNEAATSDVIISMNAQGGTITTPPAMKTVTAGTGFTVLCGATDTSTYNYDILN